MACWVMNSKNTEPLLSKELVDFVIERSFTKRDIVTPDTRLMHDLGLNGDDAIEFMMEYGKRFNVDLSRFFANEYFDGEGLQIIDAILEKLKLRPNRLKPLPIGCLQAGINLGYLTNDII
jgi:acyl carrier protein